MPLLLIPILLLIVPAIEIAVFIWVGQAIGAWRVVALVFLSAILGAVLLRYQSIGVIRKIDRDIRQGRTPEGRLFDGFLIVVGAILLIIPGFVTDLVGLLLMMPLVRRALKHYLKSRITVTTFPNGWGGNFRRGGHRDDVVDLSPEDFERQEPRDPSRPSLERKD